MDSQVIVGIDLGTTNSAIGVVESGFPLLLADQDGKRTIPSAVWFGDDGDVTVGRAARRQRGGHLVTSVKSQMGTGGRGLPAGQTPESVSAHILKSLKQTAEERLDMPVTRAVITVPAYFNDAQRKATITAGEEAGLMVERLVSEPTAAALAYGLSRLSESARVAVYDWGGGTFDVSLLQLRDGVFEVESTAGDTHLGGDDVDLAIAQSLLGPDWEDLQPEEKVQVLVEAERVKKELSAKDSVMFRLPFFRGSGGVEEELTRASLDELIAPLLERTRVCCRRAMADAGVSDPAGLDAVVLVGASTRIPAVRALVEEVFQQEPDVSQHPDEAIALGASIQGGILSGAMKNMVLLDVTPLSLGVETYGGLMNILIPRNTTIPCKAGELFTNASAEQRAMVVRILQGEREMARDNWELGQFELDLDASAKGEVRVGVQFALDASGVLEVLARNTTTGEERIVQIESSAVDVADEQVGKMVGESVEFAFEDMNERVFTEARLKAEELLPAVDDALFQLEGEMEADEISVIRDAASAVRRSVESEDHVALKAAVQVLDKKTEAMAAILVEKAMASFMDAQGGEL